MSISQTDTNTAFKLTAKRPLRLRTCSKALDIDERLYFFDSQQFEDPDEQLHPALSPINLYFCDSKGALGYFTEITWNINM